MAARATRLIAYIVFAFGLAMSLAARVQGLALPSRIVSLVPALTEMLYAIGAGPQVIAVSSYDDYPPEVRKLPRVGALLDPDTERILAMRPDLVLLYGSQESLIGQFQRAGIGAFSYRHGDLSQIIATVRRLGEVTGHVPEATRVSGEIEQHLDEIRRRVAGRVRPRTLVVFGRERLTLRNLYASGGRGFIHDMLGVAGGADVFAEVDRESVQASTETLLARAPDAIVELHVGAMPSVEQQRKEKNVWLQLESIPAVRNGRVYLLYGDHLVVPGPRVARATEEIARVLHPGAFK
jgi:cobalamin transport system substrate-binding protein